MAHFLDDKVGNKSKLPYLERKGKSGKMKLLLYAKDKKGAGDRLQRVIEMFAKRADIEIFRTINDFAHWLCQPKPMFDEIISVLLAAGREDLQGLFSIRDFFRNVRMILILPDQERDTISKGHKLYPRFVSYADGNFADVAAVLGKMLRNFERDKNIFHEHLGGQGLCSHS